ncbi:plasmid stabilization protein [Priestia megaterium]|uniref:plasmid stabilization protein n=1 Tax=Priestia megaterium TaxID=1404 RepID=UPI000BFD9A46|nr:plasmid stabilization protein [Priestia megaterium]PGH68292.1 plasmid stabilization protein [Priestia megaterium]PGO40505.1 plasmid stabilization protein [Priestia megaterium]
MPHKMTLTGSATGPLREYDRYVAFDMREKGSPSAPKGLKKSTFISYTVFVAKKAFNKTGLTKKSIMHEKILVQGEPTLDIPIDECPGEIGVICFQITVLPNKNDKEANDSNDKKEAKTVHPDVKQTPVQEKKAASEKKQQPIQPKGTKDVVSFDDIIVPEAFLKTRPNPVKTEEVIEFVKRTGHLDKPLTIEKETKVLKDGYRRYIVAKTMKMDNVPVVYDDQK